MSPTVPPDEGENLYTPERSAFYDTIDDNTRRRWELLKPDDDYTPLLPAYLSRGVLPGWVWALACVLRPQTLPPSPPVGSTSTVLLILRCLWGVVAEARPGQGAVDDLTHAEPIRHLIAAPTLVPAIKLLADVPRDPSQYSDWFSRHVQELCSLDIPSDATPRVETYLTAVRAFSQGIGQDVVRRERVLYGIENLSFTRLDPSVLQGGTRYGLQGVPPLVVVPTTNANQTVYVESIELPNTPVYARIATLRGQSINWLVVQPPFSLVRGLDLIVTPARTAPLTQMAEMGVRESHDFERMAKVLVGLNPDAPAPELDEVEQALIEGKGVTNPVDPDPSASKVVDALPPYQRGRLRALRIFLDLKPADVARLIAGTKTVALPEDALAGMIALWERDARMKVTHVELLAFARALKIDADTLDSWLDGTLPTADIATQIRNVDILAK